MNAVKLTEDEMTGPRAKIVCKRCRGTGLFTDRVMYAGIPGGCFKCAAKGWVYKDKFVEFHGGASKFYGVTATSYYNPGNPNNGVTKYVTAKLGDFGLGEHQCHLGMYKVVEITEEQARAFFAKFKGERVERRFDFDPREVFPADHPICERARQRDEYRARCAERGLTPAF